MKQSRVLAIRANDTHDFHKYVGWPVINNSFTLANSAYLDEMPHYAAFHLDLHCLSKYLFAGIQNEKN